MVPSEFFYFVLGQKGECFYGLIFAQSFRISIRVYIDIIEFIDRL